jgi:hypothetical protein
VWQFLRDVQQRRLLQGKAVHAKMRPARLLLPFGSSSPTNSCSRPHSHSFVLCPSLISRPCVRRRISSWCWHVFSSTGLISRPLPRFFFLAGSSSCGHARALRESSRILAVSDAGCTRVYGRLRYAGTAPREALRVVGARAGLGHCRVKPSPVDALCRAPSRPLRPFAEAQPCFLRIKSPVLA